MRGALAGLHLPCNCETANTTMDPSGDPEALFAEYDALTSTIAVINTKMRPAILQYLGTAQQASDAGQVAGKPCPTCIGPLAHHCLSQTTSSRQA